LRLAVARLQGLRLPAVTAVGHRVVHGGPRLLEHCLITDEVVKTLEDSVHFAPLHIPPALELIAETQKRYPRVREFACFDTAFHETMPEAAKRLPLPGKYWDAGVRRYGFHGLSYASVVHALGADVPARMVMCHLGSGCSVTALRDGVSVDTSMGLTPTGGVVMATRTGDLDPGVMVYLLRQGVSVDELERMINHDCGMMGLSGHKDIREVEKAADSGDAHALMALEVFYRTVAKTVAGYASVLGGLDLLVFTGGIGQHSERTRAAVCSRLGFLKFAIRAMPSEEEAQIARICFGLMA
jgi:acetate kinase